MKNESKRQIIIRNIAIVILIILLILTFFSNTIMHYSLPLVSVSRVSSGRLSDAVDYDAVLSSVDVSEVTVSSDCEVLSLNVYTGMEVSKGDVIGTVSYQHEDELNILKEELEQAQYEYDYAVLNRPEYSYGEEEVEIARASHALDLANAQLAAATTAEAQSAAQEYVYECTFNLQSLQYSLAEQQAADLKEQQLADLQIENLKENVDTLTAEIEELEADMGSTDVVATASGLISHIYAYAGGELTKDSIWVEIYDPAADYEFTLTVTSEYAAGFEIGYEPKKISGVTGATASLISKADVVGEEGLIELRFEVETSGDEALNGQSVTASLETQSQLYDYVVPLKAVYEDSEGKFVYLVSSDETVLGTKYYVTKTYVDVEYENDTYAALTTAVYGYVVVSTDAVLTDGMQVRTYD